MLRNFKTFIIESIQQGFVYESNAVKALKPYDVVPQNFTPAGAGSDIPDLMIKLPKEPANKAVGCELKITAASAGSLAMKWSGGKWSIGSDTETNDEKLFIIDLSNEVGILDQIQNQWNEKPYKFVKNKILQDELQGLNKREIYSKELSRFPEIKGTIPASKIEEYYNKKKTYYINVGTHGFFLLGPKNPLNLPNVPRFSTAAAAKYRARVQAKGAGNYQFTFEMSFSIIKSNMSPYNIAPTIGKTVKIDTEKMKETLRNLFMVDI
jgi:hypothetical protein